MWKCFQYTVGSVCGVNLVDKFSQGRLRVSDDGRPGRPVKD
jgi:hypothetical protein